MDRDGAAGKLFGCRPRGTFWNLRAAIRADDFDEQFISLPNAGLTRFDCMPLEICCEKAAVLRKLRFLLDINIRNIFHGTSGSSLVFLRRASFVQLVCAPVR